MLRIRRFGEMPCGYNGAAWNFRFFCRAYATTAFRQGRIQELAAKNAKVVREGTVFGERGMNVASVV